jgi:hypothetical protein
MTKSKQSPEDEFLEAIMSGDNLSGLKAQRKLIALELVKFDLEASEKSRMHRDIITITGHIIRLEGAQETQSEEDLQEMAEIEAFAKEFQGGAN